LAQKRRRSRNFLTLVAIALIAAAMAYAFWPKPALVDLGTVGRGPLMVTIDEEGQTRVRDITLVSAPTTGSLERITLRSGDAIDKGQRIAAISPAVPGMMEEVIVAPADGQVLQIYQAGGAMVVPGSPILEIGNIRSDLEVVVDLLSSDAVSIEAGATVLLGGWGGGTTLEGIVARIDPVATTRISALGVQEQRVDVTIDFTGPSEERQGLGHGFRLEARIVQWSDDAALLAPASALFRENGVWSVFRVAEGIAYLTPVEVGHSDGIHTEILSGLGEGDVVVLYPSSSLVDGGAVAERAAE
jgi:multidrug efflux pump subunit AcrA (membrane-fusion protein)